MRNRILTILWALGVATATAPAQIVITGSQGASIVIRSSGGAITVGGAADKKEEAAEDVEEFQPLAEGFAAELDALLTRTPPDFAALQDLATRIQLEHGALEPAFRYLETKQAAAGSTDTLQSSAAWCLAIMRRSYGDLQAAQEQLYDLVSSETGRSDPRAWKEYAEVLDARGQLLPALSAYGQWLSLLENDAEAAAAVRLRIALIRKSEPEVVRRAESSPAFTELGIGLDGEPQPYVGDALARLARDSDIELRNRSAVVLAMLGDPGGAADLFEVTEEGSKRFRQELRLAEWNLQADRVADARDMAWRALESATLDRDRRFALALLVEAWRRDDQLEGLLAKLTTTPGLPEVARRLQVDILRELGRVDEAMELFRAHESSGFTVDMRRELLEMCREAGREEELVATYRDLVASEPDRLEWREGLSRYFLERGLRGEALQLWQPLLTRDLGATKLMDAADATMALGLDELAIAFAGEATKTENGLALGWLFLCNLHLNRGRMAEAEHALDALDREAEPDAAARMQLGEGYERLGNQLRAVDVLERLKEARGVEAAAEDLEMRLAWLYSETGQEKKALDAWRTLWARVESIPRLAYVEDRLLNVSSRLGTLADLAIELEERLDAGQGDTKDRGLLVRLYTKANDPVSAAEILTSYGRTTGDEVTTLSEMARVYLSCADFLNYERTVRQLIDVDPEGAPDYLRQLAMSALERARPDQARPYLRALKHLERGAESAEFEAGVLALAGMHSDAIRAYRKGMAVHPDRIEASLLLADVMNKTGQRDRALGMFQYLAETADKDDLFIVALDGLLNLRAEGPVLAWARRIVLERLASRHDKMYLYQILSDLAEEGNDRPMMLRAMEEALVVANERRASVLRELMELSANDRNRKLRYGRRLVLLGDLVPPEVYLSLGDAFLEENDVRLASRTYAMATDVPDHAAFQRKVAASFEAAGFRKEALGIYEQVLIGQSGDVGLIRKVALLDEELGRDAISADLLERALELMLSRRAFSSVKREEKPTDDSPFSRMWGGNNLDDYDRYFDEVLASYLVVADAGAGVAAHLDRLDRSVEEERVRVLASRPDEAAKFTLRNYPRLLAKSALFRRLALKTGRVREAESADLVLLATFRDDASLLGDLVEQRLAEGFVASARRLIEESLRTESEKEEARFLAGSGGEATPGLVSAAAATRLFLPMVLADHLDEARSVLHRVDLPAMSEDDLRTMPQLVSVSVFLEDSDSALNFARRWIAAAGKFKESWEMQEQAQKAIDAVWPILDNDQRRSVVDGVIQKLVEDPQKASSLVYTVAELQKKFEEPLIEAEQVKEMLEKGGLTGNFYNVAGLLSLMPATEHLAVIKELWAKVPSVRRVTFLLDILAGVDAVLAEDIAAFIEDKFPAALDEQTRPVFQYYIERSIANNEKNPELALRLSEALWKKDPKEPDYFLGHASALRTAGRLQEAWDVAKASIVHLVDRESIDWKFTQAAAALANLFGGGDLGQIYQALDALEAERGKSMNSVMLRVELGGQDRDLSRRITDLKAALDRFPEEAKIRNQLRSAYRLAGYVVESLELLEKDARERPNPSVTRQVVMGWKALDQPVRARRLADELSGRAESNASKTVAAPPGKTQPASVADLKSSIEKGEVDEARRQWREVWRQFSRMRDDSRLRFFSWGPIRHGWPRDEDDENRPRSKGGLPDLDKNTPPTTPSSAYMVLAEQPFGEDEFRRQIRSLMPAELDRASDVLEGLSRAVVYRAGPEGALRELLEPVIRGLAGKSDYVSLLDLLESRPELLGSEADRILEELASTLNPSDGKQIRRLARLNARTGRTADALRLYRWCLPLLTSSRFDFWSQGVSTDEIIEELMKILDGEDRETAIEIVLAGSTPGAFENDSDRYEALVLSARARLHGAAAALEACPEIVSRVIDPANQERDQAARKALPLFVSVGRHDAALICLEKVICRRESNTLRRFRGSSGVRFQPRELAEVFPRPKDGEGVEWYQLAARSVAKWSADRRLGLDAAGQILAVLALRLHQAGAVDEAQTLAREAAGTLVDQPATLLWVIDVMTLIGLDDEAHVFTAGLLAERRLDWRRVAGHVRQVLDREGPSSALVIGEEAAEWTLSEELLAVLTDAASVLGDTEAQTRVAALVAARKAAVAADEASN